MARDRVGDCEWVEKSNWVSGSRTVRALVSGSGFAMRSVRVRKSQF